MHKHKANSKRPTIGHHGKKMIRLGSWNACQEHPTKLGRHQRVKSNARFSNVTPETQLGDDVFPIMLMITCGYRLNAPTLCIFSPVKTL